MRPPATAACPACCRTSLRAALVTLALIVGAGLPATGWSQQQAAQASIMPNYRNADIQQVAEAVSQITGKNFILDPRVRAQVTMLSSTPMAPDAFYDTFLSILQVYGFVAVESGNVVKIIPDANARQFPDSGNGAPDDIVTQVVALKNVGAAQLVPILRPLIPQYGHLAAHPSSNMLIISDRAANVARIMHIISRIDQGGKEDIEVIRLENASAADVVSMLNTLSQNAAAAGGAPAVQLAADTRTNSVLLSGPEPARLRYRALVAHLDTPSEQGGDTQVRYLRYADAEDLATKLQMRFTGQAPAAGAQGGGAAAAASGGDIGIWADQQTNALVITAPPKQMREIMSIVDKLDIRRAQVMVEAIIVEMTEDKAADLGITWAVNGANSNNPVALTNFPPGIVQLGGSAAGNNNQVDLGSLPEGLLAGVGRLSDSGVSFAALLRALQGDSDTNIIATPQILTLDNQEAEISVGQEVPFVTGQYTNTGGASNAVNPFQTIQREEVGTKLTITPQINQGNAVLLNIQQETSSISQGASSAVDLITNNRTISTSVIVQDGGILVLGGLIDDNLQETEQRVPVISRVPLLGNLFKSRGTKRVKTNLMVFIRPTILRDDAQATLTTNSKYNYIRDRQLEKQGEGVSLMPGAKRPLLPPLSEQAGQAAPPGGGNAAGGADSSENPDDDGNQP